MRDPQRTVVKGPPSGEDGRGRNEAVEVPKTRSLEQHFRTTKPDDGDEVHSFRKLIERRRLMILIRECTDVLGQDPRLSS